MHFASKQNVTLRIGSLAMTAFFALLLATGAFAQEAAPWNVVLINTAAFYDEKAGISRLVSAKKQIDTEFAREIKELQGRDQRLKNLAAELQKSETEAKPELAQAIREEGARLQRETAYRKAQTEAAMTKRREALLYPIILDIEKALVEFARKNKSRTILDAVMIQESCVDFRPNGIPDITKEFVAYYNARVAGTPVK